MKTIVKVCSHRAREKLHRLIGHETQGYYSFRRQGAWYEVPPELLAEALTVKGIKRATFQDDLRGFINW